MIEPPDVYVKARAPRSLSFAHAKIMTFSWRSNENKTLSYRQVKTAMSIIVGGTAKLETSFYR